MNFMDVVREALETKTITPVIETQLNDLMWSQAFNTTEMAALGILIEAMADGTVSVI